MPMQKNFTLLRQATSEPNVCKEEDNPFQSLQARKETLQRIMQFAATYRTERVSGGFTNIFLN